MQKLLLLSLNFLWWKKNNTTSLISLKRNVLNTKLYNIKFYVWVLRNIINILWSLCSALHVLSDATKIIGITFMSWCVWTTKIKAHFLWNKHFFIFTTRYTLRDEPVFFVLYISYLVLYLLYMYGRYLYIILWRIIN